MKKKNLLLPVLLSIISVVMLTSGCNQVSSEKSYTKVIFTDFEKPDSLASIVPATWKNLNTLVQDSANSGKFASKIDSLHQFSALYEIPFKDLDVNIPKELTFSAYCSKLKPETTAIIVVSVSNDKYYKSVFIDTLFKNVGEWKPVTSNFKLPEDLKSDDIIKAYIWNQTKGEFLIDDYKLEFKY